MANPIPRLAPVTTAVVPVRSKGELIARPLSGLDVDEDLHGSARGEVVERRRDVRERDGARDEGLDRERVRPQQLDGRVEVLSLVDPGTDELELAPEHPLEVDRARLAVDRDDDDPSPDLRQTGHERDGGGGARHLEDDVRPGAVRPLLDPGGDVALGRVGGGEAQLPDELTPRAVGLDDDELRAEVPCDARDEGADGPAAEDDDARAALDPAATDVVDRDGDRFDERGDAQVRAVRAAGRASAQERSRGPGAHRVSRCR